MTYEEKRKSQNEPFRSVDRLKAIVTLLNAEARLLAEYGGKAMLKEGPVKQAAQTLISARTGVATAYIREFAAEIKGIDATELEAEMHAANVACVEELLGRPDKDMSKAEAYQLNPVVRSEDTPTPEEVRTMDAADKFVNQL